LKPVGAFHTGLKPQHKEMDMGLKRWKQTLLEIIEKIGGIDILQHIEPKNKQIVYTLTYHRVEELDRNPYLDPYDVSTTPEQFDAQMKLVATKYHPVSAEDVIDAFLGKKILPRDAVLVTVDDGYCDFLDVIYPTCAKYGIKPVLFLATGFVGSGIFWWDKVFQISHFSNREMIDTPVGTLAVRTAEEKRASHQKLLYGLKRMPFSQVFEWVDAAHATYVQLTDEAPRYTLTWDELRFLKHAGCTIVPHTHNHPILSRISIDDVAHQVRLSSEMIRSNLGDVLPMFAIPDGKEIAFNREVIERIHTEGIDLIYLLLDGRSVIQPGQPYLCMPRIAVWQSQTLPHFHLRATPLVDVIYQWKQGKSSSSTASNY
jgi:peptidoglycan/xylan/chitin deacetylase (PgdA/CDA1 family)